jgi:hypothetical protein
LGPSPEEVKRAVVLEAVTDVLEEGRGGKKTSKESSSTEELIEEEEEETSSSKKEEEAEGFSDSADTPDPEEEEWIPPTL